MDPRQKKLGKWQKVWEPAADGSPLVFKNLRGLFKTHEQFLTHVQATVERYMQYVCHSELVKQAARAGHGSCQGQAAKAAPHYALSDEEDSLDASVASVFRQQLDVYAGTRPEEFALPHSTGSPDEFPLLQWWQ